MSNSDNMLTDPRQFLPLAPQDFQVLLLLSDQPLHGYGVVKASVDELGKATLELGSLYRIVSRMTKAGLIEDVQVDQPDSKRQRRYYRTTDLGRRVARAEALRLQALLGSERALVLLED
jgi:DNA-binding PadR family transcriptional regulator